jgi:hypothetical protein
MSTRYDFMLICNLRDDMPQQAIETLKYMTRTEDYEFDNPPNSPVFDGSWWRNTMRLHPGYINMGTYSGDEISIFRRDQRGGPYNTVIYYHTLQLRNVMHGDVLGDYLCFANWVAQYSERVGFVGYYHSSYAIDEGTDPTLLYFIDGKLHIAQRITPHFESTAPWCETHLEGESPD